MLCFRSVRLACATCTVSPDVCSGCPSCSHQCVMCIGVVFVRSIRWGGVFIACEATAFASHRTQGDAEAGYQGAARNLHCRSKPGDPARGHRSCTLSIMARATCGTTPTQPMSSDSKPCAVTVVQPGPGPRERGQGWHRPSRIGKLAGGRGRCLHL